MAATEKNGERGNLTPSSSTTILLSQSPVSQGISERVPTLSAFEITSVSDAPPLEGEEVETGGGRSIDADEMKTMMTRDGDSTNRLSSSSGDSDSHTNESHIVIQENIDQLTGETQHGGGILMNIPANPSPKPQDINGPLHSRFRRVNHYNRGRWLVRESHEPEERPESEARMMPLSTDMVPVGSNSPSQSRRTHPPSSLTTSEYSYDSKLHSRSNSEASFITDNITNVGGTNNNNTLADKSSVMADTIPNSLSRTESNSSLITKSFDGDGERESHPRDIDLESIASIPNTNTPDPQSVPYNNSIERPLPTRKPCEFCSQRNIKDLPLEEQYHTVEATVEILKEQLSQLLQVNIPYQTLLKERDELLKENIKLQERIKELESSNAGHDPPPPSLSSSTSSANNIGSKSDAAAVTTSTANHSSTH